MSKDASKSWTIIAIMFSISALCHLSVLGIQTYQKVYESGRKAGVEETQKKTVEQESKE